MTTLIADIEADNLLDKITQIHQISIIDDDTNELTSYNAHGGLPIDEGVQRIMDADVVVGHNWIAYDMQAIRSVLGISLNWRKVIDTMILSKLGNPIRQGGHSLKAWAERMGGEQKVEHEDWAVWTPEMEHRCNADTRVTQKLYHRLRSMFDIMPDAIRTEHCVAYLVSETVERGFTLDVEKCHTLVEKYLKIREEYYKKFSELFPPILVSPKPSAPTKVLKTINKNHPMKGLLEPGTPYSPLVVEEFNPGSRQHIARRLITKYGWVPKVYTNTGIPEVSEETLRDLPYPEAKEFAEYLTNEKRLSQINAEPNAKGYGGGWLHHVKPSGKVHASLNSLKAVTSRMSCASPNLQQVATVPEMRSCWVPSKGYVLLGADAEGLELRCLAHYLAKYDNGAYADILVKGKKEDGTDVHSVARDIVGFYSRDETKRVEYGWLYGAGDAKLGAITADDAFKAGSSIRYEHLGITPGKRTPSPSKVGEAVRVKLLKGFVGLNALTTDVRFRARRDGKLKGLDGRTLWVRSPHSALNLLLQSAGAILIKKAWTLFDPGIRVVMQVHDEWQVECPPDEADDIGKHIGECVQKAGELLGFRCPLASDYHVGKSWAETH